MSSIFIAEAQQGESIVNLGSSLTPTTKSSWLSRFDNPPTLADVTLNFTSDGKLILQYAQGNDSAIVNPLERATWISMLNWGNFVLYNSNKDIIWQRSVSLIGRTKLVSSVSESEQSTGILQLVMQADKNLLNMLIGLLVQMDKAITCHCLDDDGHLYLLNSTGKYLSNLTQGGYPTNDTILVNYFTKIDAEGIFRLYSHNLKKNGNWLVNWSSSNNKCDPKGLCGLNEFFHQGNWSSGCERNFTIENCQIKNGIMIYTMLEASNTVLEDSTFSIMLPLRFGRRVLTDSNVALIKVGKSTSIIYNIVPMVREKNPRKDILIMSILLTAFGPIIGNVGLSMDVSPRSFTYSDLEKMTDGFKEDLGKGSFGIIVVVKRLEKVLTEREREFQTKIKLIGRTHHKNLIHLLGYCHDGENRLLVYEYMSNDSFANILFKSEKQLCWNERIEIARNIAKGILYLHKKCESQIIHCDTKPQNILMDEFGCAKISDFGLAKLLKPDQTNTIKNIRGTKGIVPLELICYRKKEAILKEWAYYCFEALELSKLVMVGFWCALDEPSLRPWMKNVLLMLEGTVDIPISPSLTSFLSTV
ncbi:hypothetical protein ACB092_10G079800 [Castanea dentata]